ncbi:hypothetical protein Tco_0264453 [Tanacetum coccineum]
MARQSLCRWEHTSRYLANPGLVYGRDQGKHVDVDGFVDADYAKDHKKEAEYMTLTEAVKESIWLKGVLIELGVNLREIVEFKEIGVVKIGTKDNAADAFTKVVPGLKFKYCMEILGAGKSIDFVSSLLVSIEAKASRFRVCRSDFVDGKISTMANTRRHRYAVSSLMDTAYWLSEQ